MRTLSGFKNRMHGGRAKPRTKEIRLRIWRYETIADLLPKKVLDCCMERAEEWMGDFEQYNAYEQMWKSLKADIERFAEAYGKMGMCAVYPEKGNYQTFKNILHMMRMYEEEKLDGEK